MTKPSASPRQALAPGDTVNGNVKVGEPGLFEGNSGPSCASPTPGASTSAAVYIAVASFMENLLKFTDRHAKPPASSRSFSLWRDGYKSCSTNSKVRIGPETPHKPFFGKVL